MIKTRVTDRSARVSFELPACVEAGSVTVCGDFNGWSAQAHPLHRLPDGGFRTELDLAAGRRWRFRYLLDGERWENDWAADDYVPNGLGTEDSVVDLTDVRSLPGAPGGRWGRWWRSLFGPAPAEPLGADLLAAQPLGAEPLGATS